MPGKWVDFALGGHQIVCHFVGNNYKAIDYYNPVGGDEVPGMPETSSWSQFGICVFDVQPQFRTSDFALM